MPGSDIGDLITALARDAVSIQKKLDAAYEDDAECFARMLAGTPEPLRPLIENIAPRRQVLRTFEIAALAQFSKGHEAEASVKTVLLNLGYSIRFGVNRSNWSQIRLTVNQVPITKGLPWPTQAS